VRSGSPSKRRRYSLRLGSQGRQLDVALTRNQLLPRVDLFGPLGTNSWRARTFKITAPTRLAGNYGDALNRLVDGRLLVRRRSSDRCRSGAAQAESQAERARVERRAPRPRTARPPPGEPRVGQAASDVGSDLSASGRPRSLASSARTSEPDQALRVGMVTTTDLLQFRTISPRAGSEISPDQYNISRTRLDRAQGRAHPSERRGRCRRAGPRHQWAGSERGARRRRPSSATISRHRRRTIPDRSGATLGGGRSGP
jgi:hypothetical protein